MHAYMEMTLADEIKYCMGILKGNFKNSKAFAKYLDQLLTTLGAILDKPLYDSDPDYTCKQMIENLKKYLESNEGEVEYSRDIIVAKTLAFDKYPQNIITDSNGETVDVNYFARHGFVDGYMQNREKQNK